MPLLACHHYTANTVFVGNHIITLANVDKNAVKISPTKPTECLVTLDDKGNTLTLYRVDSVSELISAFLSLDDEGIMFLPIKHFISPQNALYKATEDFMSLDISYMYTLKDFVSKCAVIRYLRLKGIRLNSAKEFENFLKKPSSYQLNFDTEYLIQLMALTLPVTSGIDPLAYWEYRINNL